MGIILNYIFIGFAVAFLLDYISEKYKDHPSWVNVPEWDWTSRTMFALIWPIRITLFIYTFLKERFK